MRNTVASTMILLLSVILINININISLMMFTIADIIIYIILIIALGVSSFILTTLQDSIILPLIEVILPSLITIMMKPFTQENIVEESITTMSLNTLETPGIDSIYQFSIATILLMPTLVLLIGSILGIVYKLIIAKLKDRELEENLISIIVNYKYIKTSLNRIRLPSLNMVFVSIAWFMLILFVLVKLNLNNIALLILNGLPISIITMLLALLLLPVNFIVVLLILITTWFSPIVLTAYIIDTIIPVIDIIKYEHSVGNGITLGSIKAMLSKTRGFELSDVKILKERTILIWDWNDKNPDPLRERYIEYQLQWHKERYNKGLKYLPPNCSNDTYYKDMGVCNPDEICKLIKNPISYPLKKLKIEKSKNR